MATRVAHSLKISLLPSMFVTITCLFLIVGVANAETSGTIVGSLVDKTNGDPIAGATIRVEGTSRGGYTNAKGTFEIKKVPAGVVTVTVNALGYKKLKIDSVVVQGGMKASLELACESNVAKSEEVVVVADAMEGSDATLLKERQESNSVSDAIGSESIDRLAGASVASIAGRVTGVSVTDGKYITVRGLGDRYMNYQLNGAQLASSDPDRNDVAMDQFSASFVESIVTMKSFTPDQPGAFTGGAVNVKTKAFPSERSIRGSLRFGYNNIATLSNDFTAASTSSTDWIGFDDGSRALPELVRNMDGNIPSLGEARTDKDAALALDQASKSFSTPMSPTVGTSGLPSRLNLSYADIFNSGSVPVGIIASLQYAQNFEAYTYGQFTQWQLTGKAEEKESLEAQSDLTDRRGTSTAFWGAMFSINTKPAEGHQIGMTVMHNQRGENIGRYLSGSLPRDLPSDFVFETRTQQYIERGNTSVQLTGENLFPSIGNALLEWRGSYNRSTQDEPDLRFFSNEYVPDGDSNLYYIDAANYALPQHFYRDMVEDRVWFDASVNVPVELGAGGNGSVKFGGAYDTKFREFNERRYEFRQQNAQYEGDADAFFSDDNVGIVDTSRSGRPVFGNYIVDVSQAVNNYDGSQTVSAGFVMADLPVTSQLRLVGGVRLESTDLQVVSMDTNASNGKVDELDMLPSLSAIYALSNRQNLRVSYGKTLARPTFRELAPFSSFDFVGGFILNGNPDLKQTYVDNYDVRWEWFTGPADVVAVSGYYKSFENPIEQAIVSANNQLQFQNVGQATVIGAEFEARTSLGVISNSMSNFYIGGNLTLTHSQVDIPEKEMEARRELLGEDVSNTRQLQGQSPFLANVQLGYISYQTGTDINITLNTFGDRLSRVSIGGSPNVFEKGRTRLDIVAQQRIVGNLNVKIQALNLLNPVIREFQTFKGVEYDMTRYVQGQTFTIGIDYSF